MLTQVVDAVLGHQHAVAAEVRHTRAGHLEVLDDIGHGAQCLVRRHVHTGTADVAVEDHVQVLVRGDALEHLVGDRVLAALPVLRCETRVASSWNVT